MVGLHNLYWYYGSRTYKVKTEDGTEKVLHASEAFQGWVFTGWVITGLPPNLTMSTLNNGLHLSQI